jgi:2-oxo-3-hexenedioate decarboxylase/2-keto-4-pentenoate hydratase
MASDQERIEGAARFLFDAREDRAPFSHPPEDIHPRDLDEAYAVQEALQALLVAGGSGAIAGYKIALTSPVMQEFAGLDHPCAGAIFAATVHRSPVALPAADFIHLGVECEIAVRLGADLPAEAAPHDRASVAGAVAACMAALELVEDRGADYASLTATALVADNAWNAGVVLGPEVSAWRDLDIAALAGQMTIDDAVMGEGIGADALGHPFEGLAWLANHLAARGRSLKAGMIVMTGSIVATRFPDPGDRISARVEGLGEASLTIS